MFVILIIAGVLIYVYVTYELPIQKNTMNLVNISIFVSTTNLPNTDIFTGFQVLGQGEYFSAVGNTSTNGASLISLPSNSTFLLENINLGGQNFYTTETSIDTHDINPRQIRIVINPAGSLILSGSGSISNSQTLNLTISSNGYSQDLGYCVRWSLNILDVVPMNNDTQIQNPSNYKYWDQCYFTNKSLDNSQLTIPLNITLWNQPNYQDFVNVSVFDEDYRNGTLVSVDSQGNDIGEKDQSFNFGYYN